MIKSIIRVAILFSLGIVAIIGILCTPPENSGQWFTDLFTSKAIGILAAWAFIHLFRIWKCKDPRIRAFDESQSEELKNGKFDNQYDK